MFHSILRKNDVTISVKFELQARSSVRIDSNRDVIFMLKTLIENV